MRNLIFALMLIAPLPALLAGDAAPPAAAGDEAAEESGSPRQELFTGKVVLVREALKKRGIRAYEEIGKQVALQTADGELIPIIPDWRGRAFFQDERLRNRKVDLVGYRRDGLPYMQVLMVFTFNKEGERQYTDYWCDICSIPMYEIKPCDCCQGPIELRFQPRGLPDYITGKSGNESRGAGASGDAKH